MAFASNSQSLIERVKVLLKTAIQIRLLGASRSFVGREIKRNALRLCVFQQTYVRRMLQLHNLTHARPVANTLPIHLFIVTLHPTHDGD